MITDFIVIGSGLAGLTSALILSESGRVLLLTKSKLTDSSTNLAQGGIAAVTSEEDSFESHIKDTLVAGCFHNKKEAVKYLVENGPKAIDWLTGQGVKFATKDGKFDPTREAAHSYARVLHATDITGHVVEKVLVGNVRKNKNILVWEDSFVTELTVNQGSCSGCTVLHLGKLIKVFSNATILATGGLGQLYEWTTNPAVATGDGIALAVNAGAEVADLEFIQFHPTALKNGKSPLFLLSEALRGEGAALVKRKAGSVKREDAQGERFMTDYDKRGELAPRDIVARAIFNEQQKGYEVYLDIRHKEKEYLLSRFPGISKELEKRGYDLSKDLIPVTPVAHYSCGGVKVDLYGRTTVRNLFAFGEVSCSGVHGANRLASNSLLEAVVFPLRISDVIASLPAGEAGNSYNYDEAIPTGTEESKSPVIPTDPAKGWRMEGSSEKQLDNTTSKKEIKKINSIRQQIQHLMWEKAGIVRTKKGLKEAISQLETMGKELENSLKPGVIARGQSLSSLKTLRGVESIATWQSRWDYRNLLEIQNMLLVAKLICRSALKRKISLGAHFVIPES